LDLSLFFLTFAKGLVAKIISYREAAKDDDGCLKFQTIAKFFLPPLSRSFQVKVEAFCPILY
jgi:hypothetical protein